MSVPFSVLVVCSANICRSPAAAALLRDALSGAATVTSAGTHALVGHDVDLAVATALRETGMDVGAHEARQATAELLAGSDLVLAAATSHRDDVVALDPAAAERTFTLREFARLGADLGSLAEPTAAALRARVAAVAGLRTAAIPRLDDIGDPFAAPFPEVQRCVATIAAAVEGCVAALGLPVRRRE